MFISQNSSPLKTSTYANLTQPTAERPRQDLAAVGERKLLSQWNPIWRVWLTTASKISQSSLRFRTWGENQYQCCLCVYISHLPLFISLIPSSFSVYLSVCLLHLSMSVYGILRRRPASQTTLLVPLIFLFSVRGFEFAELSIIQIFSDSLKTAFKGKSKAVATHTYARIYQTFPMCNRSSLKSSGPYLRGIKSVSQIQMAPLCVECRQMSTSNICRKNLAYNHRDN